MKFSLTLALVLSIFPHLTSARECVRADLERSYREIKEGYATLVDKLRPYSGRLIAINNAETGKNHEDVLRLINQDMTPDEYGAYNSERILLDKKVSEDLRLIGNCHGKLPLDEYNELILYNKKLTLLQADPLLQGLYRVSFNLTSARHYMGEGKIPFVSRKGNETYGFTAQANLAQRISHVLDNSTFGIVQTIIGGGHIIVNAIVKKSCGGRLVVEGYSDLVTEASQVVLKGGQIGSDNYSLGDVQVGGGLRPHEAGHSVASASLGPLYLPTVVVSYLVQNQYSSFLEDWADLEANAPGFFNSKSAEIDLGKTTINGESHTVVVMKFKLEQRQVDENFGLKSDRKYEWLSTEILAPFFKSDSKPVLFEVNLLKKKLNLTIGDKPGLGGTIQTEQRYLNLTTNPTINELHLRALDWSARYGLEYNLKDIIKIAPSVGVGLSAGLHKTEAVAGASFNAAVDIKLLDYATLTGKYEKEWFTNGRSRETYSAHLHNDLRDPFQKAKFIRSLDFGVLVKSETWDDQGTKTRVDQMNATMGLRF